MIFIAETTWPEVVDTFIYFAFFAFVVWVTNRD